MYFIACNMTLTIFLDCSNNENKVANIQKSFGLNVVTEIPINKPFFVFKENGLNFIFNSDNAKSLHIDFLKGAMGWRLKRSDHEKLLKKTLGKNNKPLSIFEGDELPHDTFVQVELLEDEDEIIKIHAVIYVVRDSQKQIVIGKGGGTLKKIGQQARLELEDYFKKKVFLKTWVKVKKNWNTDSDYIQSLGVGGSYET